MLPYTQNETCLAIVLGHEIAHAVAKHSAEQLSKQQNQQVGTAIVGSVLNQAVGNGVGDVASAQAYCCSSEGNARGFEVLQAGYFYLQDSEKLEGVNQENN